MDYRVYWLWLQHAFGAGSAKPYGLFKRFKGGIKEFYEGGPYLWNSMEMVSEKEARMLTDYSLQNAELMLEMHERMNIEVITPECEKYPENLRNIFDPPAVLYIKGRFPDVDNALAISVVGTRKACEKSVAAAITFGYQLALSNVIVVSGIALGVDSAAHKGAIKGMGSSVSVLPCGLTNGYLVENHALRKRISESGAVISEYPLDTPVNRGSFQVRNRIISGLSHGVLLIEAPLKSGALITARLAKEQNRDVFVFPGDGSARYAGGEALIADGAKSVADVYEILEEYELRFSNMYKAAGAEEAINAPVIREKHIPVMAEGVEGSENQDSVTPIERKIIEILIQGDCHISSLEEGTGLDPGELFAGLTTLELSGKIQALSGKRYRLLENNSK